MNSSWIVLFAGIIRLTFSQTDENVLPGIPIVTGLFQQHVHTVYTTENGLPDCDIIHIACTPEGQIIVATSKGISILINGRWNEAPSGLCFTKSEDKLSSREMRLLKKTAGKDICLRAVASYGEEKAAATNNGLFLWHGTKWELALPKQGHIRWAPVDVRAVAYTPSGVLWFAAPIGVGYRKNENEWRLFSTAEGLPFNDFTCMAADDNHAVWFGTSNGAICFQNGMWTFRQGRRWLADNVVRDIAIDSDGNAWIATSQGVSCIRNETWTLKQKATFFEEEIERYHRRTAYGYVCPARLETPGDKSTAKPQYTDNEGHGTGLYLAAVSLGYAATDNPNLRQNALKAFKALAFLSEVTQGGTHPAPKGFIARTVVPTTERDPNLDFGLDYDLKRRERDALWKIIQPRWPIDATGQWYWKNDSSSDELDGHFFGYGVFYDRVCQTEEEKEAVRQVVRNIADHLIEHGYNLVDYDGTPTRWGHFSPDDLNRNEAWVIERGLNSLSILTYLSVAHHITGDPKYRQAYLDLALNHGYAMNGMTQPKDIAGPGTFGQPDDVMAFMNYYHLIRYETDPKLLSMYYHAIRRHWLVEQYERNPFINFVYAACCTGKMRTDQWGTTDLTPPHSAFQDAVDTLKRYPLDLINWPMSNAHRKDLVLLGSHLDQPVGLTGHRTDGFVFPIDEHHEIRWDRDPYVLSSNGDGKTLREGVHFLLAYYMGLAHGFIRE